MDEVSITFEVKETTNANLSITDVVGRKLITILDGQIPNGTYNYVENLGQLESGFGLIVPIGLKTEQSVQEVGRQIKQVVRL